jgi:formylglycine-generating enzyme required for sulfatase activity
MFLFHKILILLFGVAISVQAVPPVLNYAGQVAVNGQAFDGNGLFKFALVNTDGTTTYWSNDGTSVDGSEPQASVAVSVNGGLYAVLLGNTALQGMGAIDPAVFAQHTDAKMRVWFSDGVNGFQQLSPDRPFASVPYAFSAETAGSAHIAPGSIVGPMLDASLLADLNASIGQGSITRSMLEASIFDDLNASITDGSISTAKMDPNLVRYFVPEISLDPSAVSIIQGTGTTLSVQAVGKFLTYQWQKNGVNIVGETASSLNLNNTTAIDDANYSVLVSNDWGTVSSPPVKVTIATALPAITILGSTTLTHEATTLYSDSGATAVDALGDDLTSSITITSADINVTEIGNQIVTYSVTDTGGNTNTTDRTVIVQDTTNPVITLMGDSNLTHNLNTAWVEPGYYANDSLDGNLTANVSISGTVDIESAGAYIINYAVLDSAGNRSDVNRTVNVEQQIPPHNVDLGGGVSLEMLWVKPGTFTMGLAGIVDPVHQVTISKGFYLGKFEVTQAQYKEVMTGSGLYNSPSQYGSSSGGYLERPVEKVSYNDAQEFLARLNDLQSSNLPAGWAYVLPTEAEWEYACRAGTTSLYSWGNDINVSHANYTDNYTWPPTNQVGTFASNPWGFFDMHGNVMEWTADAYGNYATSAQTDPFNAGTNPNNYRVCRGGSWYMIGEYLSSAMRFSYSPTYRFSQIGFRVALKQQ